VFFYLITVSKLGAERVSSGHGSRAEADLHRRPGGFPHRKYEICLNGCLTIGYTSTGEMERSRSQAGSGELLPVRQDHRGDRKLSGWRLRLATLDRVARSPDCGVLAA